MRENWGNLPCMCIGRRRGGRFAAFQLWSPKNYLTRANERLISHVVRSQGLPPPRTPFPAHLKLACGPHCFDDTASVCTISFMRRRTGICLRRYLGGYHYLPPVDGR